MGKQQTAGQIKGEWHSRRTVTPLKGWVGNM